MRDQVFSDCIGDVNCPVLSKFYGKKGKNPASRQSTLLQFSVSNQEIMSCRLCLPDLNSRVKNYMHSGWWLVLIRTLLGIAGLQCPVSNYILAVSTKTSISLVRDQGKQGRDSHLTEKLYLHSLLQDDCVPQAAAAAKTVYPAAAASHQPLLETSQPNWSCHRHKKPRKQSQQGISQGSKAK